MEPHEHPPHWAVAALWKSTRIAFGTWQIGGAWARVRRRNAASAAIRPGPEWRTSVRTPLGTYGFRALPRPILGKALRGRLSTDRDES